MTVKEIAALAHVSPAAVSRYLNGGPLSEQKREAIRRVIEETGFQPNKLARDLRRGTVKQIGLIVPRLYSNAAGEIADGIHSVLLEKGYMTVLGSTGFSDETEAEYLRLMASYPLAGVIVMAVSASEAKEKLYGSYSLPIVITGQNMRTVSSISHEDELAMYDLTQRMLGRNRKHFVYLGVDKRDDAVGVNRYNGFLKALADAGIREEDTCFRRTDFTAESGYHRMQEILQGGYAFDAVLCATDMIALGALAALREAGIKVPEEVSIAGIGNEWANRTSVPRLTSARFRQFDCGRIAAEVLLELIKDREQPKRTVKLGYTIEEGGSI